MPLLRVGRGREKVRMFFCQSISSMLLLALVASVNAYCNLDWLASKRLSEWQSALNPSTFSTSCDLIEDEIGIDLTKLLPDVSCFKHVNVQTNQREVSMSNPSNDIITITNVFETNCTQNETLKITFEDLLGRRLSLNRTFDPIDCFRNGTMVFKVGSNEKVI